MKWNQPLLKAKFLKRYKRFFADVELINPKDHPTKGGAAGEVVTCHVANTGSLRSVLHEGAGALIAPAVNPESKLKFSLKALQSAHQGWVGIDTGVPNCLLAEVFSEGRIPEWSSATRFQPEWKLSSETRFDGALWRDEALEAVLEVKNVTLRSPAGFAQFPDAVTERGQKHLRELIELSRKGIRCEMIFVIQREDIEGFEPADEWDPQYALLLRKAVAEGVRVRLWVAQVGVEGVEVIWKHPVTGLWKP